MQMPSLNNLQMDEASNHEFFVDAVLSSQHDSGFRELVISEQSAISLSQPASHPTCGGTADGSSQVARMIRASISRMMDAGWRAFLRRRTTEGI